MNAHRSTDAVVEAMPTRKTKVRAKPSRGWSLSVFRMKRGRPRTRKVLVGSFIICFLDWICLRRRSVATFVNVFAVRLGTERKVVQLWGPEVPIRC